MLCEFENLAEDSFQINLEHVEVISYLNIIASFRLFSSIQKCGSHQSQRHIEIRVIVISDNILDRFTGIKQKLIVVVINYSCVHFQEQSYLVKRRSSNDWVIHQCSNCEMLTHATHATQGNNKVLVNRSLKVTILNSSLSSCNYNVLFTSSTLSCVVMRLPHITITRVDWSNVPEIEIYIYHVFAFRLIQP